MSEWTHSDGLDRETRQRRAKNGKCVICGGDYDHIEPVKSTDTDSDWPMLGRAFVHGDTECIEWPTGVTQEYDTVNERIIQ